MDALTEAIVEWVAGERVQIGRLQLIAEIRHMASHCKLWPHATVSQWNEAIESAVKQNLIVERDGKLSLAPTPAKETQDAKQLDLF